MLLLDEMTIWFDVDALEFEFTESVMATGKEILLLELATQFRVALADCPKDSLPINFRKFPRGTCGDTSLLLSKWLEKNGENGFTYVCGKRGKSKNWQTHAWLERDSIVIDITADQFGRDQPSVYVGPRSRFHNTFEVKEKPHSDFERYDPHTVSRLRNAYRQIKKYLSEPMTRPT